MSHLRPLFFLCPEWPMPPYLIRESTTGVGDSGPQYAYCA